MLTSVSDFNDVGVSSGPLDPDLRTWLLLEVVGLLLLQEGVALPGLAELGGGGACAALETVVPTVLLLPPSQEDPLLQLEFAIATHHWGGIGCQG